MANPDDSDEIAKFFSTEEEEDDGSGPAMAGFMGFGGGDRETSAMVSALAHVMSGEHTGGGSGMSMTGSSSGWGGESSSGGGGGGVKREREETPALPEAGMRYYRGFGSLVHGEPSATLETIATGDLKHLMFCFFHQNFII